MTLMSLIFGIHFRGMCLRINMTEFFFEQAQMRYQPHGQGLQIIHKDSNLHFYDTHVTDFWYPLPGDVPEDK